MRGKQKYAKKAQETRRTTRKPHVKLTKHAHKRSIERKLDPDVVSCVAAAVRDLLNDKALKVRHNGHTIVASRNQRSGEVTVVTAWKN